MRIACTAPADGLSHYDAQKARWLRPLNSLLVAAAVRKEVVGQENLPQDGSHVLCLNHQSYLDPSIATSLNPRDWRFMAAKEQFVGPVGQAMADMGAFPVDRSHVTSQPLDVGVDLLNQGIGVGIFGEGRIWGDGQVHDLKKGPAWMACHSEKCETIVPAAISYQPHRTTLGENVAAYASAAALVGGGIAASLTGNPWLRALAGTATGAVTGAVIGGAVGFGGHRSREYK